MGARVHSFFYPFATPCSLLALDEEKRSFDKLVVRPSRERRKEPFAKPNISIILDYFHLRIPATECFVGIQKKKVQETANLIGT